MKRMSLSVFKMKELEDQLKKLIDSLSLEFDEHWGVGRIDRTVIAKKLNLRVCYVEASELPKDSRSELTKPLIDEEYNGVIKILCGSEEDKTFSFMHEVFHYLIDVGIGNKVEMTYTMKDTPDSEKEQEMNYLASATLIPLNCILEDLKRYDENRRTIDEIKFVRDLMTRYGQSKAAIYSRVSQARALSLLGL